MRPFREICKSIDLKLTEAQESDAQYLEACGLKFCVDFGYKNAREIADDHFRKAMDKIDQSLKQP